MRDRFLFLGILFSLGIHGIMLYFLVYTTYEISKINPPFIEIKWELPSPSLPCSIKNVSHSKKIAKEKTRTKIKLNKNLSKKSILQKHKIIDKAFPIGTLPLVPQKMQSKSILNLPITKTVQRESYRPMPTYPWICRRRGQEGKVSLLIQVNAEGYVISAIIKKSSGHPILDQAALKTVKTWIILLKSPQKLLTISFRLEKND